MQQPLNAPPLTFFDSAWPWTSCTTACRATHRRFKSSRPSSPVPTSISNAYHFAHKFHRSESNFTARSNHFLAVSCLRSPAKRAATVVGAAPDGVGALRLLPRARGRGDVLHQEQPQLEALLQRPRHERHGQFLVTRPPLQADGLQPQLWIGGVLQPRQLQQAARLGRAGAGRPRPVLRHALLQSTGEAPQDDAVWVILQSELIEFLCPVEVSSILCQVF